MTDAVDEADDVEESEDILSLPLPELTETSDSLLLTEGDKNKRIKELEAEVVLLNQQLTEARNLTNSLYTEINRYKQVNGQVGWLIGQFRETISGSDIGNPSTSLPTPLPSPLSQIAAESEKLQNEEQHGYLPEPMMEVLDAEDQYSEDWETSEEADDQFFNANILCAAETPGIGPQIPRDLVINAEHVGGFSIEYSGPPRDQTPLVKAPRDPTPIPGPLMSDPEAELDALLAVATPETRISEIFRRWCPAPPKPPPS